MIERYKTQLTMEREEKITNSRNLLSPAALAAGVRLWLIFCAIALGLFVQPALADLYEIKGLGVDATAKSAAAAKIAALKSGQEAAFNLLVRRLAVVANPSRLPKFTNAETARLLAGLVIEEEKTTPVRYIARLTVRFRARDVQRFLTQYRIPFSDKQAPKILLLTVWEQAPKAILWKQPNPWRTAWGKIDAGNSITPLMLPLGDLTDISLLSVDHVLKGDAQALAQLKMRYGVDYVLTARAQPLNGNSQIKVTISGESPMGLIEFIETYKVSKNQISAASFRAAREFLSALELRWKQGNQNLNNQAANVFAIAVPFSSLAEWRALRAELTATHGVARVDIKSLSADGALVHIRFAGGAESLIQELGVRGLMLNNIGNSWILERR